MKFHQLESVDGFIAQDLDEADVPTYGVVRSAKKILQAGAAEMARSLTYSFATLEMKRSGASGGLNALPDARAEAVAGFVTDVKSKVETGELVLDVAKGIAAEDFAGLYEVDGRSALWHTNPGLGDELAALSAVCAVGDLDGKRIAIEAGGPVADAVAALAGERGATVVDQPGKDHPSWKVLGAEADVLFVGSKMGALNHVGAEHVKASVVVPIAPVPVTTKAFAMLRRAGVTVLPDFITTCGPLLAMWADEGASVESVRVEVDNAVSTLIGEVNAHDEGPMMGACYRAEAFIQSWHNKLPFGRPFAG